MCTSDCKQLLASTIASPELFPVLFRRAQCMTSACTVGHNLREHIFHQFTAFERQKNIFLGPDYHCPVVIVTLMCVS